MMPQRLPHEQDLDFEDVVRSYVVDNPRFFRRPWLEARVRGKMAEDGKQFVLLTAPPGSGKSAFMAQLAHDHPEWLRYFIRRNQRDPLSGASAKSMLIRIGFQLVARQAHLFESAHAELRVHQKFETAENVTGARIGRLVASPFFRRVVNIEQEIGKATGVSGVDIGEFVAEARMLPEADLLRMALVDPARVLQDRQPEAMVVVLIDALDESLIHSERGDILEWLTSCPELPENVRVVVTSRPSDDSLNAFREKQQVRLSEIAIAGDEAEVKQDVAEYLRQLVNEPSLSEIFEQAENGAAGFANQVADRAGGNLGYVDAVARGIDAAVTNRDVESLRGLLTTKQIPKDQESLYAFFLHQIKAITARERVEVRDEATGEVYDKPVWPTIYHRLLGVLAVAMEPLELEALTRLAGIRADPAYVTGAFDRLRQFLDRNQGRYRLYHATVAEFLTSERAAHDAGNQDLYQDGPRWHRTIADAYWASRADWSRIDGYGRRNFARHLHQARDFERMQHLMSVDWMRFRFAEWETYDGFAGDLKLAWDLATRQAIGQIERHEEPSGLAASCRCACIHAALQGTAATYPAALVQRAVALRLWSVRRAISTAKQVSDPCDRFDMLLAILRAGAHSAKEQDEAVVCALESAPAIVEPKLGGGLEALAPYVSGDTLESAWTLARAIRIKWKEVKAPAMAALAVRFEGPRRTPVVDEAVKAALVGDVFRPGELLRLLMPYAGEQAVYDAIVGRYNVAELVIPVIDQFSAPMLARIEQAAMRLERWHQRVKVLAALANAHTGQERERLASRAVEMASQMEEGFWKIQLLKAIGGALPSGAAREALALAHSLSDEEERASVLAAVAPSLDAVALAQAREAAESMADAPSRRRVLVALAPRFSSEERDGVLTSLLAVDDPEDLVSVAGDLAPILSQEQLGTVLEKALPAGDGVLERAIREIAAHARGALADRVLDLALSEELRNEGMEESVAAAAAHATDEAIERAMPRVMLVDRESERDEMLAGLAPRLKPEQVTAWLHRVQVKADGTASISLDELPRAALAAAVRREMATIERSEYNRALNVKRLLDTSSADVAAAVGEQVRAISDPGVRGDVMLACADASDGDEAGLWAQRAFEAAMQVADVEVRLSLLARARRCLGDSAAEAARAAQREASEFWMQQEADLNQQLRVLPHLEDEIAARIAEELLPEVLADSGYDSVSRQTSRLLIMLPHLTQEAMTRCLGVALKLMNEGREEAACELARRGGDDVVAPLLAAAASKEPTHFIDGSFDRVSLDGARAMLSAALVPRSKVSDLEQAFHVAAAGWGRWGGERFVLLAALGRRPERAIRDRAQDLGLNLLERSPYDFTSVVGIIAPLLDADRLGRAVDIAAEISDAGSRWNVLAALREYVQERDRVDSLMMRAAAEIMSVEPMSAQELGVIVAPETAQAIGKAHDEVRAWTWP